MYAHNTYHGKSVSRRKEFLREYHTLPCFLFKLSLFHSPFSGFFKDMSWHFFLLGNSLFFFSVAWTPKSQFLSHMSHMQRPTNSLHSSIIYPKLNMYLPSNISLTTPKTCVSSLILLPYTQASRHQMSLMFIS